MGCEDRLRGLEEHQGLLRRLQPQRRTEPDVSGNPAPRGRARALWLLVSCWDAAQLLIHPLPRRVRSAPRRLFQSRARGTTMSGLLSSFARGAEAPSITDQAEIDRLYRRSEEHTSELHSPMRNTNAVFPLKKQKKTTIHTKP